MGDTDKQVITIGSGMYIKTSEINKLLKGIGGIICYRINQMISPDIQSID
jgi:hypothetical protein